MIMLYYNDNRQIFNLFIIFCQNVGIRCDFVVDELVDNIGIIYYIIYVQFEKEKMIVWNNFKSVFK